MRDEEELHHKFWKGSYFGTQVDATLCPDWDLFSDVWSQGCDPPSHPAASVQSNFVWNGEHFAYVWLRDIYTQFTWFSFLTTLLALLLFFFFVLDSGELHTRSFVKRCFSRIHTKRRQALLHYRIFQPTFLFSSSHSLTFPSSAIPQTSSIPLVAAEALTDMLQGRPRRRNMAK